MTATEAGLSRDSNIAQCRETLAHHLIKNLTRVMKKALKTFSAPLKSVAKLMAAHFGDGVQPPTMIAKVYVIITNKLSQELHVPSFSQTSSKWLNPTTPRRALPRHILRSTESSFFFCSLQYRCHSFIPVPGKLKERACSFFLDLVGNAK